MSAASGWPADRSEMAARIRDFDWANSPFGPLAQWPQSLRCHVDTVLSQLFPAVLTWGPDLIICAYNDAYLPLLDNSQESLGRPFLDVWSEAAEEIAPYLKRALNGKGSLFRDAPFTLTRNGYREQAYFDYSYAPAHDGNGRVIGVLNIAVEITDRILANQGRKRYAEELRRLKNDLQNQVQERTEQLEESRAELEQQGQFLDTILANLDSQVFVWDRQHRFVYANRALRRLWGKEHEDYSGKGLHELGYPPELADRLSREINQVFVGARSISGETDYPSPSGVQGYYTYVISPVADTDGRVSHAVGIAREIGARKQLEHALEYANRQLERTVQERTENLRKSESRYRALFESIDQGFCIMEMIFDAQGRAVDYRFLETNPAFERHTGLIRAQGRTAREMVPDLEELWYEVYGRVAKTGKSERFINGSEAMGRWFEVDAFRVGDPAERHVALLFRDVSDRKRAEDELLRVLGLLEGITSGSEDLIAALDNELCFLYFNEAYRQEFKKLWHYDIEEGSNILEAMAPWPAEREKARRLWSRALGGESFRVQVDFGSSESQRRIYDLRFNPIRDPQGRSVGAAHIFRDITAQVAVQSDLRDSEERLRESDRRKDEYLAMLGHELRNPLSAVRNATELIKGLATEDHRLQRASSVLERQTAHMAGLIDGLLEVSRIARGKIDLNRRVLDLRELLRGVIQDRSSHCDARQLSLQEELPETPAWVSGDPVRLAQIFDNLLGNAIKFTHPGGQLSVKLAQEQCSITVTVRDTGIGIRPEMLTRVFEPFYQEKQDIARASGGLGLGLALVKGLVEQHDGEVLASSDGIEAGAEFKVRLPRAEAPARKNPTAPLEEIPPLRILIVEDNADAGESLCDLLSLQGHSALLVGNAAQALNALWQGDVDLVLCDLGLPGMSGFELARAIREDSSVANIPLVALTGYGQPEDRRRSAAAGFNLHLTKPVSLQALNEALETVFNPAQPEATALRPS